MDISIDVGYNTLISFNTPPLPPVGLVLRYSWLIHGMLHKRVPEVRWQHISEMPMKLRMEM